MVAVCAFSMFVIKRNGAHAGVAFDRITESIQGLAAGLSEFCDPVRVSSTLSSNAKAQSRTVSAAG